MNLDFRSVTAVVAARAFAAGRKAGDTQDSRVPAPATDDTTPAASVTTIAPAPAKPLARAS